MVPLQQEWQTNVAMPIIQSYYEPLDQVASLRTNRL